MRIASPVPGPRRMKTLTACLLSCLMLVAPLAQAGVPLRSESVRPPTTSHIEAGGKVGARPPAYLPRPAVLPAPLPLVAPSVTATKADAFDDTVIPNGKAEPGQVITYTVTVANAAGAADATGVTFSDSVDANTTLDNLSINTQPVTDPDTYAASGNIPIALAAPGVLANDRDPDTGTNAGLTVTKVGANAGALSAANVGAATDTTASGRGSVKGSVTLAFDGSFSYEPPPGYTGADTFAYEVSDGATTDTNTVTVTVSGMAWFVSNSAPGSLNRGTFSQPFTSLASFNTANNAGGAAAAPNPKDGDTVALRTGSGAYAEADGVNLRAQQKLVGEGVAFNTSFTAAANSSPAYATFAAAPGSAPAITTSAGNGVDLAADNTLRGFNVGNTPGFFKINGGAVGSPVINAVSLTGTGGALSVSASGAFGSNVSFGTLESTSSPGAGLNLVGVTGTLGITSGGAGLSGSAAASPTVSVSGGAVSFTYPGNVTKASGTGALVSVSGGHTGSLTFQTGALSATSGTGLQFDNVDGTYSFNGTTSLNGGDAGIDIVNDSSGTFGFSANVSINSPSGAAFSVSKGAAATCNPTVTYAGTVTQNTSGQRAVNIDSTTGGTISFTDATNGVAGGASSTGVNINSANSNVSFAKLTLGTSGSRMTNQAVTITNGGNSATYNLGPVSVFTSGAQGIVSTNFDGTLNTASGTVDASGARAVSIDGPAGLTTLGVTLTKVSSSGSATNGILMQDTGGAFTVTGSGGAGSGGTIQNTGGVGILLTNATGLSFNQMIVQNTSSHGISGSLVNNFSFTNGTITVSGTTEVPGRLESNINFYQNAGTGTEKNLTGAVTITGNTLNNALHHGVNIIQYDGTISSLNISNNNFTSATASSGSTTGATTSHGSAVSVNLIGSASTSSNLSSATITNNTITGFPGNAGILVVGGNATPNGPAANMGLAGNAANVINITGNSIQGFSAANRMNTQAIAAAVGGHGQGNFNISNNGTAANPVANMSGHAINLSAFGQAQVSATISNNVVVANNIFSSQGVSVGVDTSAGITPTTAVLNVVVSGNNISSTNGVGIFGLATRLGTLNMAVLNNTVGPPTGPNYGISVSSGSSSTNEPGTVCLDISGNNTQGSSNGSGTTFPGINIRRQTSGTFNNVFGIEGMAATSTPGVENYVNSKNTSTSGTFGVGGTALGSATTGFTSCSSAPAANLLSFAGANNNDAAVDAPGGISTQAAPAEASTGACTSSTAPPPPPPGDAAPTLRAPAATKPLDLRRPKRDGGTTLRHSASDFSAPLNSPEVKSLARGRRKAPKPGQTDSTGGPSGSGGTVSINVGTLRAGDSVTITFTVTVEDPYSGGPAVSNQGTVSGSNFSNVVTDDPDTPAAGDPTLTPVNATDVRVNDAAASEPASGQSEMLFTLTLSQPAGAGGLSVTYTTAGGTAAGGASCGGPIDYVSVTNGTATVPQGSQVATIPVTVCNDTDSPESSETFTLNVSNASAGTVVDPQATGTITQGAATPGTFLISELRTSGPAGPADDFVEFYNNSDSPLTVAASDASAGYGLFKMGATCNDTPVLLGTIPNGTVIPARGHYLMVGSAYSLADYGGTNAAAGDLTMASDVEPDRNVAVFSTADVINVSSANRLDAVGFGLNTNGVCDLLREPGNLPAVAGSDKNHSFFRNLCDLGVTGCTGNPKDTNDNSADFRFADTQATIISGVPQRLGAPGPENLASPVRRDTTGINLPMLDGSQATSAAPNRVRTFGVEANATFGTLLVRRRVVNNTSGPVTRLRFRVIELSTTPTPGGGVAELRALTAPAAAGVTIVNDTATCGGPSACAVTAQGTTLEGPPGQPNGGGFNSTLSLLLGAPLDPGQSIPLQFKLGIMQTGNFRFYIIVEALP